MKSWQLWIEFLKKEVFVKISMGHGKFLCLFKKVGVARPRLDFFVWSSMKSKVRLGPHSRLLGLGPHSRLLNGISLPVSALNLLGIFISKDGSVEVLCFYVLWLLNK